MLTAQLATDTRTLLHLVRHHAKSLEPIVLELLATIPLVMGSDSEKWTLRQSRVGGNSFSLSGRGRQYHFRSYDHYNAVHVFDSYQHGRLIAKINTRNEARAYIESLVP